MRATLLRLLHFVPSFTPDRAELHRHERIRLFSFRQTRITVMHGMSSWLAVAALSIASSLGAEPFPWHSGLTDASSDELAAIHESLLRAHDANFTSFPVQNEVWEEPDFELVMESGTLFVEPPIDGVSTGAFFEGRGAITFNPRTPAAKATLFTQMGERRLANVPVRSAYLFSLRSDSPIGRLANRSGPPPAASSGPSAMEVYAADKSAMRQLGLQIVGLFLNRDSIARDATLALFPMEEIRTRGSEEARLLYAFDPTQPRSVSLSVFGHEKMAEQKPYKHRFYAISSYPTGTGHRGIADVDRYRISLSLGTSAESAVETAVIELRPVKDLRAVRLNLTAGLEISEITSASGESLPFLQWKELQTHPNFDQTVIVSLPRPSRGGLATVSLTVRSEGVLFEPWLGSYVLVDEDDWFPRLDVNDDAHHELELTIPRDLTGIGVGELVSAERDGRMMTLTFRTSQPTKNSTFYFGNYTKTEQQADNLTVELYQDRRDILAQRNAKFAVTEISNAIKVFSRLFVPLDIETLRVTSTRRSHGRGFEGLLLLGARGTGISSESWADLFRAHEVAHQWWGQYIRPKHWPEDRWLSEALAEFSAMEYYRIRYENEGKVLNLMESHWIDPLAEGSMTIETLSNKKEKISGRTSYPICAGTSNVYTKGPMVINMLRYLFRLEKRNDEAFFEMLRDFLRTYRYQFVTTAGFKAMAEKHLGSSLDWFFEQWIEDGGLPVLKWRHEITKDRDGTWILKVEGEQIQKEYRLIVPIYIHFPNDKLAVRPWIIEGAAGARTFKLPMRPSKVTLNDNLEALIILEGA
jgi:hypothetical protein